MHDSLLISRVGGQAFRVGQGTLVDWWKGVTFQSDRSFCDSRHLVYFLLLCPPLPNSVQGASVSRPCECRASTVGSNAVLCLSDLLF